MQYYRLKIRGDTNGISAKVKSILLQIFKTEPEIEADTYSVVTRVVIATQAGRCEKLKYFIKFHHNQ